MPALIPADAVAIGVGAFFGAVSRYQAGRVAAEWIATDPNRLGKFSGWHTAGINIAGSFLLGGVSAAPVASMNKAATSAKPSASSLAKVKQPAWMQGMSPRTKLMMGVGFCGSFTTFSTYSVDVVTWISEGKTGRALSYVAANNVAGFVAAAAGMILVKKIFLVV
jgi:fluoride ion exporter CrcB/FEX